MMRQIFTGADIFDGHAMHEDAALVVEDGRVVAITRTPPDGARVVLQGGVISPGFIDLQVNGGGGSQVDGHTTVDTIRLICDVQARLGATDVLPTLITNTPAATAAVIAAGVLAARDGVPGFLGLHLEGPHLDPRRKGAHDPALIRPMGDGDLAELIAAKRLLPVLKVTVAPEAVMPHQISQLVAAGIVVSLGHSDCSHTEAKAAIAAGASCVTHLFNAMSQLGNREPGLVGAALTSAVHAGLIADGIHVAPDVLKVALAAKPEGIFLVSDCMAFAGTAMTKITLGGRRVRRNGGILTLDDGTLAGADLTLAQAVGVLVQKVGIPPTQALAMTTRVPAGVIGRADDLGALLPGRMANMVHLSRDFGLLQVWRAGVTVSSPDIAG